MTIASNENSLKLGIQSIDCSFIVSHLIRPKNIKDNIESDKIAFDILQNILDIKNLKTIYQQKISSFDELKTSLLHQAFSGALTKGFAS